MKKRFAFVFALSNEDSTIYLQEDGVTQDLAQAKIFASWSQAFDFIWNIPTQKYKEFRLEDVADEQSSSAFELAIVDTEKMILVK